MILILTSEAGDYSHIKIIDWLEYYKAPFKIISGETILKGDTQFYIKENNIYYDGVNLTKTVTCVFYRRWFFGLQNIFLSDKKLNKYTSQALSFEIQDVKRYLFYNLRKAIWIPNPSSIIVNKLEVLNIAKECKLNVPDHIVTNDKKSLLNFYKKHNGKIITKAIGNFSKIIDENNFNINPIYTKEVPLHLIENLPEKFTMSFFQKKIEKILEYRIFYFYKKIYPTAILSQEQKLTEVDSRRNNDKTESKLAPIQINNYIKNKIIKLMQKLNLTIGSIDMILSKENKFFFLEVNPVGQIGGYSKRCGYSIEQDIAEKLIEINDEFEK